MSGWTPDDPMPGMTVGEREVRGLHTAYVLMLTEGIGYAVVYVEPAKLMWRAFRTYRTWDHDDDLKTQLISIGQEPVAYLQRIQIEPAARGGGLGTHFLKKVLAWIDAQGITYTFLHAMPFGLREGPCVTELENWYFRHGFRSVATEEDREDYIDKSYVLMRRDARR